MNSKRRKKKEKKIDRQRKRMNIYYIKKKHDKENKKRKKRAPNAAIRREIYRLQNGANADCPGTKNTLRALTVTEVVNASLTMVDLLVVWVRQVAKKGV